VEEDRALSRTAHQWAAPYRPVWLAVQDQGYSTYFDLVRVAPPAPLHWAAPWNRSNWASRIWVLRRRGEEEHWSQSMLFDANGRPFHNITTPQRKLPALTTASVTVLSSLAAAHGPWSKTRARPLARVRRFNAEVGRLWRPRRTRAMTMVARVVKAPCVHAAGRWLYRRMATIDYLNTHGYLYTCGRTFRRNSRRFAEVFGDKAPKISSTKRPLRSLAGCGGVTGAIYCPC